MLPTLYLSKSNYFNFWFEHISVKVNSFDFLSYPSQFYELDSFFLICIFPKSSILIFIWKCLNLSMVIFIFGYIQIIFTNKLMRITQNNLLNSEYQQTTSEVTISGNKCQHHKQYSDTRCDVAHILKDNCLETNKGKPFWKFQEIVIMKE